VPVIVLLTVGCGLGTGDDSKAAMRAEAVRFVEAGDLGSEEGALVELPQSLASASASGEIMVFNEPGRRTIVFFEDRGVLDRWSGYVYDSTGELDDDPLAGGGPTDIRRIDPFWFFVEAH
jgi:hypothetical protein